ncbi:expressed unknown protein [Seminavis robusta]|uniref:Uncharacterized protein n=1 Tax=Seminavis robusta TaxID=568900 RepID=A0A9N8D8F6_9STRA|nr:expressed unknown protein [Seminavis robusta]|eukprot:Sro30_g019660.1 n/a (392) ;mRNA; f:88278-89883
MASEFGCDDNETESEALVLRSKSERVHITKTFENGKNDRTTKKRMIAVVAIVASAIVLTTILSALASTNETTWIRSTAKHDVPKPGNDGAMTTTEDVPQQFPQFSCPSEVRQAQNYDESFEGVYTNISEHIIESNITAFIESFRHEEYDGWGKTYEEVKAGLHEWKIERFTDNLNDGSTIYESASGIGLSILLTLEAVQEVKELKSIKVYGNEYVKESVYLANKLLPALLSQVNATLGSICQGDSTDLHFVPSNSFDVVFTGYISTLLDPLNFGKGDLNSNYELYEHICLNKKKKDWEAMKLAEIAQERQEDWFGLWVQEMIRIAKPGAAIIIEQVSRPYCKDMYDWGGVPHKFWSNGIHKYGWDVDRYSLDMSKDQVFTQRYNVFMRKNL